VAGGERENCFRRVRHPGISAEQSRANIHAANSRAGGLSRSGEVNACSLGSRRCALVNESVVLPLPVHLSRLILNQAGALVCTDNLPSCDQLVPRFRRAAGAPAFDSWVRFARKTESGAAPVAVRGVSHQVTRAPSHVDANRVRPTAAVKSPQQGRCWHGGPPDPSLTPDVLHLFPLSVPRIVPPSYARLATQSPNRVVHSLYIYLNDQPLILRCRSRQLGTRPDLARPFAAAAGCWQQGSSPRPARAHTAWDRRRVRAARSAGTGAATEP